MSKKLWAIHLDVQQPLGGIHKRDPLTIEILSNFYQTIITILIALIAAVAGLAYWTVKLTSETKAEEIARQAAQKEIANSRSFHEIVDMAIKQKVEIAMEEYRETLEQVEDFLSRAEQEGSESVQETVVEGGKNAPAHSKVKSKTKRTRN